MSDRNPAKSGPSRTEIQSAKPDKRPFDKKKWRENKYSNKLKVQKFQDKRDQSMKRKYFRMLKKDGPSKNPNLIPIGEKGKSKPAEPVKMSYKQAKQDFERRQKSSETAQKRDEKKQRHLEKQAAIQAYREKKAERFKVLSKKTSKGQPLMAGRIELLLEKIKAGET